MLRGLSYETVHQLVTQPMQQLGIDLSQGKAIVDRIFESTKGHLNLVQILCNRLIQALDKNFRWKIDEDDVIKILSTSDWKENLLTTYWGM